MNYLGDVSQIGIIASSSSKVMIFALLYKKEIEQM
jgi:hypothetical protein